MTRDLSHSDVLLRSRLHPMGRRRLPRNVLDVGQDYACVVSGPPLLDPLAHPKHRDEPHARQAHRVIRPAGSRSLDAGYTLLELAAVIAIVMIASFVVIAGVRSIRAASMTTSTARLAAAVRYLHDLAVLNNRPYRMVFDLSDNSYWGELADAPDGCSSALLASEEEMRYGYQEEADKPRRGSGGATARHPPATEDDPESGETAKLTFKPKDNLLKKKALPNGIEFSGIMTSHQEEVTEEGQAEVFFFPAGYVEKAHIYVTKDDDIYTVETLPLKGIAVIHPEELDPREILEGNRG